MKYSLIFPGQGSQSLAMLADLAANFPLVEQTFAQASEVLGFDLWRLTQQNQGALNQTENTQPAMLAAGYATYKVLNSEIDLSPICMAGHSLGEWTALVCAGALDFADAIKLVKKRAVLMQSAQPAGSGAMAAILGLDAETVVKICTQYTAENPASVAQAANFNTPKQIVISGDKNAIEAVCDLAKKSGAKRALMLAVSVPSHCDLMQSAAQKFAVYVNATEFKLPNVAVLHNIDAQKSININEIRAKLILQLHQPVQWTKTVLAMRDLGATLLIESGPGKVLTGLTMRIDKSLKALAALDFNDINNIDKEIRK